MEIGKCYQLGPYYFLKNLFVRQVPAHHCYEDSCLGMATNITRPSYMSVDTLERDCCQHLSELGQSED